jgi:uncharacterized membrane protein
MYDSILAVLVATLAFVGSRFLLSHPLRAPLAGALGERSFSAVYSVVALLTFIWMVYAYGRAPRIALWGDPPWARLLNWILMAPSVLLVVTGFSAANPTLGPVTSATKLAREATGALAITRHPLM